MKTGLVLEGGGMRGLYTAGVLDYLMDRDIRFDYCIGVSAGACHGTSYVSRQRGRSYKVNTDYLSDGRYMGFKNFLTTRSVFGMDFIFDTIPHQLNPFDYETFLSSPCEFKAGVTDVTTGKPVFFGREKMDHTSVVLRASSAIPLFSPIVEIDGGKYLDGGTSNPIPYAKALEDGCDRLLVVLTQHREYEKSPEKFKALYSRVYKKYPAMVELLDHRYEIYNAQRKAVFELEKAGKAVVIAPKEPAGIGRFEKELTKLRALYDRGYNEAKEALVNWPEIWK